MEALVLAAGKGTRMRSEIPKVLHELLGQPMLAHVLDTLESVKVKRPAVVIGAGAEQVRSFLEKRGKHFSCVLQKQQKGTGHAVMMAAPLYKNRSGMLLIWPGDMPLVRRETLQAFIEAHEKSNAKASVLSALRPEPKSYGRILRAGGKFYAIREELDASEQERRIQEVNTGIYLFDCKALFAALKKIKPANAKQEFYLTDAIEVLAGQGDKIEAFPFASAEEGQGINSRVDLASGIQVMNKREIVFHQENGVTVVSPETTFIAPGVKIGQDTVIYPCTYIESGVRIGSKCEIGPFAKLRKGADIGNESVIGSFVEVSRSKVGKKVLAKHLAYLGDAVVGDGSNIGAGTITANYDGKHKHQTRIGKKVLVGSNTVFVAPVSVGDNARTGAGSVVIAGTKVKKGDVVAGVPAKSLKK